jgi:chromosome segregation protein
MTEKATRGERSATVAGEIEAVEAELVRLDSEIGILSESIEIATQDLEPLIEEHDETVEGVSRLETQLERERERLIDAERDRGHSGVVVERIRGEQAALHQRIYDDLDLVDPAELLAADQLDEFAIADLDDAEREISRLKDRLRRVGYAGDNAVEDYETERARHAFLREQLADVEGAASSIRTMLDDVRSTMNARFQETFSRVSLVFSETFATLFGGGQAKLVMVQDEDGAQTGGVDIVAQPPGKRLQSLALLSGGERALTGVALLFAILKVNPTPFCLLDEVDAALDEANVVRFRDQLQHLAAETQAIIITHNRGTIESANTLYGVSMKDDGTSTVLSLRLTDVGLAD